jgi:hypothetical protein
VLVKGVAFTGRQILAIHVAFDRRRGVCWSAKSRRGSTSLLSTVWVMTDKTQTEQMSQLYHLRADVRADIR